MIDKLELGIVYNKEGKMINHRSLLKVIVNPFLRLIGYNIATIADVENDRLYGTTIMKCQRKTKISFTYDNDDEYHIVKLRRII